ncbi:hypothetical protein V8B97DRAFT_2023458 [Scleroderma yunnanense]
MDTENLKVSFFPPLHHQRRIWVLDTLRRERITEIVDIGCGEGGLLAALCQPAPWLGPRSHWRNRLSARDADEGLISLFDNVLLNDSETPDLHPVRIAGLDISTKALQSAAELTSPSSENALYTRWEPLEVNLWHGSLDSINPAFVDTECIVASEVIEHLTDDLVAQFAPVLLGVYHPRTFLMTTPSYTFNARFSPPGFSDPVGHLDPTGRTNRVFRHSDHKFEWTTEEFARWCATVSKEWGYTVEVGSVGAAMEDDPWGRDKQLGGATQVAAFRRKDDSNSKRKRERRVRMMYDGTEQKESHRLVITYHFAAHPQAGHPRGPEDIRAAVVRTFEDWGECVLRVEDLWFSKDIGLICGGSIELLIEITERDARLRLQRVPGQRKGNWTVELIGGVQQRRDGWSTTRKPYEEIEEASMEEEEEENEVAHYTLDTDMGTSTYDGAIVWGNETGGLAQDETACDCWARSWGNGGGWTSEPVWN